MTLGSCLLVAVPGAMPSAQVSLSFHFFLFDNVLWVVCGCVFGGVIFVGFVLCVCVFFVLCWFCCDVCLGVFILGVCVMLCVCVCVCVCYVCVCTHTLGVDGLGCFGHPVETFRHDGHHLPVHLCEGLHTHTYTLAPLLTHLLFPLHTHTHTHTHTQRQPNIPGTT